MRQLITRPNKHGIGIDVGWRVWGQEGTPVDVWFGNSRDAASLRAMIADTRKKGQYLFTLSPETEDLVRDDRKGGI